MNEEEIRTLTIELSKFVLELCDVLESGEWGESEKLLVNKARDFARGHASVLK